MNRTDPNLLGCYLVVVLAALGLAGCATGRAVRESADQVKATAKDVSRAVAPLPPLAEEARQTVEELRGSIGNVDARLPVLLDRLDLVLVRTETAITQAGATMAQGERTLAQLEELAATWRGKDLQGGPAGWVKKAKRWAWLLVFGLVAVPSPFQRQQREALARAVQWVLAVFLRKEGKGLPIK